MNQAVLQENSVQEKARMLFEKYGSAASEAMFDYPFQYFEIANCEGVILYRIEHHCALVFGDPLCPAEEIPALLSAFHEFCRKLNCNIIYIIVSEKFADLAMQDCKISLDVCEELIIDPQNEAYLSSKRLKHRLDKAMKQGLTMHEYLPMDQDIEKILTELAKTWAKSIKGPNIFLGHLNFFETYEGKRWFYVKDGDRIISMAMLTQVNAHQGWLLKFFMTLPDAFQGTSEFLMAGILNVLKQEDCRFLSKGTLPVDSLHTVKGLSRFSESFIKMIFNIVSRVFRFKERKEYWFRYHPQAMPAYLLFYRSHIGLNEIRALMKAFKTNY